jgi:hypothetical protein
MQKAGLLATIGLAYRATGVVYGDIGKPFLAQQRLRKQPTILRCHTDVRLLKAWYAVGLARWLKTWLFSSSDHECVSVLWLGNESVL